MQYAILHVLATVGSGEQPDLCPTELVIGLEGGGKEKGRNQSDIRLGGGQIKTGRGDINSSGTTNILSIF